MNILKKILDQKNKEVQFLKNNVAVKQLETSKYFSKENISLQASLKNKSNSGIIAEFKRKSPSKGEINIHANVDEVAQAYTNNKASGISILTDSVFFGGNKNDLLVARKNIIPILRKDFIIDEYQVIETKSIGADVVLLIASCLTKSQVKNFSGLANSLGLEVLLEIHNEKELDYINYNVQFVGINNRNLKSFEVDIENSLRLAKKIPKEILKIAESGISTVEDILEFKNNNFEGFLIGELFMKNNNPSQAFESFIKQLNI